MTKICQILIRKNTKNLRNQLRLMGFHDSPLNSNANRSRGLIVNSKSIIGVPFDSSEFNLSDYLIKSTTIVDCGVDENLFLQLAMAMKYHN